jgi:hypothetical protein
MKKAGLSGHTMTTTRRFLGAGIAALLTALFTATNAAATPPTRFTISEDETIFLRGSSLICGFDVYIHVESESHTTIFHDAEGNVTREIVTGAAYKWTYFSPTTGRSYTTLGTNLVRQIDYTGDAGIGTTAIYTTVGFIDDAAAEGPPSAGRAQFAATVIDVSADGLFRTIEVGEEISLSGAHTDIYPFANCAALAP